MGGIPSAGVHRNGCWTIPPFFSVEGWGRQQPDLDIALRKVAKAVSKESSEFQYSRHAYKRRLSKSIAREAVSEILLKLP